MVEFITPNNAKLMLIVSMTIFGTIGVFSHYIDLPPAMLTLVRGSIGVATLLVVLFITKSSIDTESISGNLFTLVCSGACLAFNWLLLFEAYASVGVSLGIVLNDVTPALVILLAPLALNEKLTKMKFGCALLALFGLVLVTGVLDTDPSQINVYGILCGIFAAVFYTAMVLLNKKLKSIGSFDRTIAQISIATVIVLAVVLLTMDFSTVHFTTTSIVFVVILGVVHTGLAFFLYFGALAYVDAQTSALMTYIEPVLSVVLAVIILGEDLGAIGWIGAALVIGSTMLAEILSRRKRVKTVVNEQ